MIKLIKNELQIGVKNVEQGKKYFDEVIDRSLLLFFSSYLRRCVLFVCSPFESLFMCPVSVNDLCPHLLYGRLTSSGPVTIFCMQRNQRLLEKMDFYMQSSVLLCCCFNNKTREIVLFNYWLNWSRIIKDCRMNTIISFFFLSFWQRVFHCKQIHPLLLEALP